MNSWRDEVSVETQETLDELCGQAVELAADQVAKRGGFLPFALTNEVNGSGGVVAIGEPVDADEMIRLLWLGARRQRDDLVAVAVVADVRLVDEAGDAIRVQLEHRDGIALEVTAPYRRQRLRRRAEIGELQLGEAESRVW